MYMIGEKESDYDFLVKLKLFIPAGEATVSPPLGPILSQYGVNTVQFCKEFNDKTIEFTSFFNEDDNEIKRKFILVVHIYIYFDKTFKIIVMKPTVQFLLVSFLSIDKPEPNKLFYKIHVNELILLAKFKFPFLKLFSACMLVKGVARSLGISVIK